MVEVGDSLYIADCVFAAFLSYTAIMFNIVAIYAMRKTPSLPKPLRTLLLSLAVSDLGVGLLVQPLNIALKIMTLKGKNENRSTYFTVFGITADLLCFASFLGIVVISADRFLAIHLHLRYRELVTHKRVVALVVSIWVFSAFLSLLYFWIPKTNPLRFGIISTVCLFSTAVFYYKIYFAVRHHANQIQTLQVQAQNGEMVNAARLRKSAVSTFYVYLVFLVCYLPNTCIFFIFSRGGNVPVIVGTFADTLVFLNSSLNPLIYCWKMKNIRHTIMTMLRKIYLHYN